MASGTKILSDMQRQLREQKNKIDDLNNRRRGWSADITHTLDKLAFQIAATADVFKDTRLGRKADLANIFNERTAFIQESRNRSINLDAVLPKLMKANKDSEIAMLDASAKVQSLEDDLRISYVLHPEYADLYRKKQAIDDSLAAHKEKVQAAEASREMLRKGYEEDKLFSYLMKRNFNDVSYKYGVVTKFFDGLLAKAISYTDSKLVYDGILAAPENLAKQKIASSDVSRMLYNQIRVLSENIRQQHPVIGAIAEYERLKAIHVEAENAFTEASQESFRNTSFLTACENYEDSFFQSAKDSIRKAWSMLTEDEAVEVCTVGEGIGIDVRASVVKLAKYLEIAEGLDAVIREESTAYSKAEQFINDFKKRYSGVSSIPGFDGSAFMTGVMAGTISQLEIQRNMQTAENAYRLQAAEEERQAELARQERLRREREEQERRERQAEQDRREAAQRRQRQEEEDQRTRSTWTTGGGFGGSSSSSNDNNYTTGGSF